MPRTALITGATGTVGTLLVHALAGSGVRARAFVRNADKARTLLGAHADIIVGDLADRDALRDALTGADALFLACGNVPQQIDLECAAIDAATSTSVRRVVKLSARGAGRTAKAAVWRGHAAVEEHLTATDLSAVILRPSFYMSNLLAAAEPVRHFNALPAAAGTAPIAMIDPADIAAVAARALLDDTVPAGVLHLTGPEALTYSQVAQQLSDVTCRPISYIDVPPDDAAQQMRTSGISEPAVTQILEIFAGLRRGEYATVTDEVPRLTGRPASTLTHFVRQHAAAFSELANR
ncbi:NmrA family NAD(P)-binding protein [Nakamurella sp. GG22]